MRYLIINLLFFFSAFAVGAQVTAKQSEPEYFSTALNNRRYQTFSIGDRHYFALQPDDIVKTNFNLFSVEANGGINDRGSVDIEGGTFKNASFINSFRQLGNRTVVLVETRDKAAGKNTLSVRGLSASGTIGPDEKTIGVIEYKKMLNPGDWLAYTTPDKQHLAILAVYVGEKGAYQKCQYYFLDSSLNILFSKEITLYTEKKKNFNFDLFASDKGDIYLVDDEYDKSYRYPVVYKKTPSDTNFVQYPLILKDPYKNISYRAGVGPDGSLSLAGYFIKKAVFTNGDIRSEGEWFFNSEKPAFLSTQMFEKPITNTVARSVAFNGNTLFLTGEQMLQEKQPSRAGDPPFTENYTYKFGNILVAGYDVAADTKYDLQLTRSFTASDNVQDLFPASAIVNGKLMIVYNDLLAKYKKDPYGYKVPVAVTITKEGLLEQPVHFEKELETTSNNFHLLPYYFFALNDRIILLSGNGSAVRAVTVKD